METSGTEEMEEESHSPIDNDPNLLHAITGRHPIESVRNVVWDDHTPNRLSRFDGFPAQRDLVQLKQQTVDAFECRSGPTRAGWSVAWKPFDEQNNPILEGLTECLRRRRPLPSVGDKPSTLSMQQLKISNNSLRALTGTVSGDVRLQAPGEHVIPDASQELVLADEFDKVVVFDTILISPGPPEISTKALQDLPIGELIATPAFCFLWVRDSSEFNLYLNIMEGWGFRQVETVVWFANPQKGFTDDDEFLSEQGIQEAPELSGLKELSDLCRPSDYGVSTEDFSRFSCADPVQKESWSTTTNAWGAGGGFQYLRDIPQGSGLFRRTARYCLLGINGKVKRSTDGHIANSNIDPDVILSEDCVGSPPLIFDLIENLALGCRRLHIFGDEPRRGWVTVGPEVLETDFDIDAWSAVGKELGWLVRMNQKIEDMRPKSPEPGTGEDRDCGEESPLSQTGSEHRAGGGRGGETITGPTSPLSLDLRACLTDTKDTEVSPMIVRQSSDTYGRSQGRERLKTQQNKTQPLRITGELRRRIGGPSVGKVTPQLFTLENIGESDLHKGVPSIIVHGSPSERGVRWISADPSMYENPSQYWTYGTFSERRVNGSLFEYGVDYSGAGMHLPPKMPYTMDFNIGMPKVNMSRGNTVNGRLAPLDQYIASLNSAPALDSKRTNSYTPAEWVSRLEGMRLAGPEHGHLKLHEDATQAWFIALNNMDTKSQAKNNIEMERLDSLQQSHFLSEGVGALCLGQAAERPDLPPPMNWREAGDLHPYYKQLISNFMMSFAGQLIAHGQYEETCFRAQVEEQIDIFFMEMISMWGMIGDDRV